MIRLFIEHVYVLVKKDLQIEWRTRARIQALLCFALATLLLFSFAIGPDHVLLKKQAAAYFWLAQLFASTLSLSESLRIEHENRALSGLVLIPVNWRAFFIAKSLANTCLIAGLAIVLIPVMIVLFDLSVSIHFLGFLASIVLAALAISAPGTLFATLSHTEETRDVMLPLLLFPLMVPALIAAIKASQLYLLGDAMGDAALWLQLLIVFNLVYWTLGLVLFPFIVDDI